MTTMDYRTITIVPEPTALERAAPGLILHLKRRADELDAAAQQIATADWRLRSAIDLWADPTAPPGALKRRAGASVLRWHAAVLDNVMGWAEPRTWFLLQLEAQSLLRQTEAFCEPATDVVELATIFDGAGALARLDAAPDPGLLRRRQRRPAPASRCRGARCPGLVWQASADTPHPQNCLAHPEHWPGAAALHNNNDGPFRREGPNGRLDPAASKEAELEFHQALQRREQWAVSLEAELKEPPRRVLCSRCWTPLVGGTFDHVGRCPRCNDERTASAVVDEDSADLEQLDPLGIGIGGLDAAQAAELREGMRSLGVECGGMREGRTEPLEAAAQRLLRALVDSGEWIDLPEALEALADVLEDNLVEEPDLLLRSRLAEAAFQTSEVQ